MLESSPEKKETCEEMFKREMDKLRLPPKANFKSFNKRNQQWERSKRAKSKKAVKKKEIEDLRQCTFTPELDQMS